MASDLGYILIIPLAGVIFHSLGRHPIAGMAAAFAGVSGGFSANLFIGTIDPLLAGLSTEAARILDPDYYVMPTANYYFMAVSTFLIAGVGTWITNAVVEPRLGKYSGDVKQEEIKTLSKKERKGLKWVLVRVDHVVRGEPVLNVNRELSVWSLFHIRRELRWLRLVTDVANTRFHFIVIAKIVGNRACLCGRLHDDELTSRGHERSCFQ